ncbi:hypothetical protein MNBD_ALPHA05-1352, partial [hydrothermal vent metagenome]
MLRYYTVGNSHNKFEEMLIVIDLLIQFD